MKVLLVGTCLGVGGAEKVMVNLADSYHELGHGTMIVSLKGEALMRPRNSSIAIRGLYAEGIFDVFRALWQLRTVMKTFRPDVVHAHLFHAIILTRVVRLFVRIPKLVTTTHSTKIGGVFRTLAYRLTEPLSDFSSTVSVEAADEFVRKRAVKRQDISVVYNGISLDEFKRDPGARTAVSNEFRLADGMRIIVAVGRLSEPKDYPNLLQALASLRQVRSDFMVLIAGEGALRANLLAMAKELGVERHVLFLGLRRDVRTLLSAADVFVLSSAWEGFPMVVGEAMACECAIVATDCGGVREFVGEAGFLVPPRDPEALASKVAAVLDLTSERRQELGAAARVRIHEHFSLQASVGRWLTIYGVGTTSGAWSDGAARRVAAQPQLPLKVLLVGTCLGVGGAERVMVDMADALTASGHEVTVVALKGEALLRPKDPKVRVHCLEARGVIDAASVARALRGIIRGFRPDVVHAHLYHAIVFMRLLRLFVRMPLLVTTSHNTKVGDLHRVLAYRLTEPLSDVSTNVSNEAVDAFIKKRAASRDQMIVVHNGISLEEFWREPQARERIQAELGIPPGTRIVTAVGRLGVQKDYPNLLQAVARLPATAGDFAVLIAGVGDLLPDLQELARTLGLDAKVRFLGLRRDVRALLSAADVFVLSSEWEGFPMVVGEAMACECTVVATDCGGVTEFVGDAGYVVPRKDPRALATALDKALQLTAEARAGLGRKARERIRSNFSLEASIDRWLDIYRRGSCG